MIRFPWTVTTAPGFLLEITTGCNIRCRGCYKIRGDGIRSLTEIERDLETALRLRRVQTVSIAGAEPTLHPQLPEIVSIVRRRGLRASLLTNGLLLTDDLLTRLKVAGLDVAMVHVDEGQQRPDLPPSPALADINDLRREITRRVSAHGIDAGLCATIYPDTLKNVPSVVRLMIESEHIGFLFASHYGDIDGMVRNKSGEARTDNGQVLELLAQAFGLEPFAQADPARPLHWISYFVPVIYRKDRAPRPVALRSGALDSLLLSLPRWLSGRNLFYCPNSLAVTLGHVLLNRVFKGDMRTAARVLMDIARGG